MTKCENCEKVANVTWHGKSYCWDHFDAANSKTVQTPAGEASAPDDYNYDYIWGI